MSDEQSPFVTGARVAVRQSNYYGYNVNYIERFVDKVYKTGRFTLVGDTKKPPQQWSPRSWRGFRGNSKIEWTAIKTGDSGYHRSELKIWDESTDKEISDKIAQSRRRDLHSRLVDQIQKIPSDKLTDLMLVKLQEAIDQVAA